MLGAIYLQRSIQLFNLFLKIEKFYYLASVIPSVLKWLGSNIDYMYVIFCAYSYHSCYTTPSCGGVFSLTHPWSLGSPSSGRTLVSKAITRPQTSEGWVYSVYIACCIQPHIIAYGIFFVELTLMAIALLT